MTILYSWSEEDIDDLIKQMKKDGTKFPNDYEPDYDNIIDKASDNSSGGVTWDTLEVAIEIDAGII